MSRWLVRSLCVWAALAACDDPTLAPATPPAQPSAPAPQGPTWVEPAASDDPEAPTTLQIQRGHTAPVFFSALDHTGRLAATAGKQGPVRLWHAPTGRLLRTIDAGPMLAIALSPDGRTLATATKEGAALWRTSSGKKRRDLPSPDARDLRFDPTNTLIAAVTKNKATIYDAASGQARDSLSHEALNSLRFDTEGKRALLDSSRRGQHRLLVWDLKTRTHKAIPLPERAVEIAFIKGGVAAALTKNKTIVTDFEGTAQHQWGSIDRGGTSNLVFSPDGETLHAEALGGRLLSWETRSGKQLGVHKASLNSTHTIAISGDGRWTLLAGKHAPTLNPTDKPRAHETFDLPRSDTTALAVSPDGTLGAVGNRKGDLTVWSLEEARPTSTIKAEPQLSAIAFSPDATRIALISGRALTVYDTASGERLANHPTRRFRGVRALTFNEAGDEIIWMDKRIEAWRPGDQRHRVLQEDARAYKALHILPARHTALVCTKDALLRLDTRTGTTRAAIDRPFARLESARLDPTASLAAVQKGRTLDLIALDSGQSLGTFRPPLALNSKIKTAFVPDGSGVLVVGHGHQLWRWDPRNLKLPETIGRSQTPIVWLEVTSRGRAVSVDKVGTIEVRDLHSGDLLWSGLSTAPGEHLTWTSDALDGTPKAIAGFAHLVQGTTPRSLSKDPSRLDPKALRDAAAKPPAPTDNTPTRDIAFLTDTLWSMSKVLREGEDLDFEITFVTPHPVESASALIDCGEDKHDKIPLAQISHEAAANLWRFGERISFKKSFQDCTVRPAIKLVGMDLELGPQKPIAIRPKPDERELQVLDAALKKVAAMQRDANLKGRSNDKAIVRHLRSSPAVRSVVVGPDSISVTSHSGIPVILRTFEAHQRPGRTR